jgi:hypothetical protein
VVATLKPHQLKAVEELDNGKILCGGTGVGKTITAVAYCVKNESPKPVYVITTALKRDTLDWQKEFVKLGIAHDNTTHGSLTVDSWNNLSNYKDVTDAFFIFDEQRAVGSGSWSKAFIHIAKRNRWIMLSATPGDTWMDYIPVFCANGWYKNKTDFVRQHVIFAPYVKHPKVDRYVGVGKLVRLRKQLLVQMPYERHTTRESYEINVGYDKSTLDKVVKSRWHVYEGRPLRNVAEMFAVARKVVNSDSSRIEVIRVLMEKHPKLIVFYNFDYELEILRSLGCVQQCPNVAGSGNACTPQYVSTAEWNGHRHDPIPTSDRWIYLVQYTAGSEGWNCIETDAMVFYSLTYSWRQFWQAHGRIDRLNTPFKTLKYYILMSDSWIDKAVWKALRVKKSFNEASEAKKMFAS